ncbi:MAG: TlpA family protein disulfide reductase [Sandarakinorhabdus sp.]|nr:TlpA family protein disulfide reductase [Sandarakinorhabdus sp.]
MTIRKRILLLFAALFAIAAPVSAAPAGWTGTWRVALAVPAGSLPFGLEVGQNGAKVSAVLLNAPERMRAESATIDGDTLTINFPSYGSRIELKLGADDRISGQAFLSRSSGPAVVAVSGERGSWRFSPKPAPATANFSGRWQLAYGNPVQFGEASFKQTGNKVSGSVQLPSGDFRYLSGEVSGNRLQLSTFDGNAASLWDATLANGTITGAVFTATGSKTGTSWTAKRAPKQAMEAVAVEKAAVKRFSFRFPDSKGRMVSLADPAYRGKVVVVTLGGTWCPNCHDEATFMGPYAAKRRAEGLEVIALQFEYGTDAARNNRLMDSFASRYKLPYPLLLAGQPTPESSKAALPDVGPIKVYPSRLFIGRDGTLREVHVGWAGPATGALNVKAMRDFDETVTKLLKEKA